MLCRETFWDTHHREYRDGMNNTLLFRRHWRSLIAHRTGSHAYGRFANMLHERGFVGRDWNFKRAALATVLP